MRWGPTGCPARRRRWRPGVGLATCLYRAAPADGRFPSRLAALGTDWHFLPGAALGEAMGGRGAATAPPWRCGRRCWTGSAASPPFPTCWRTTTLWGRRCVGLACAWRWRRPCRCTWRTRRGPRDLLAHELRWARTLRSLAPAGYLGMGVTHPLAWGLLASALAPSGWGAAALTAAPAGAVRAGGGGGPRHGRDGRPPSFGASAAARSPVLRYMGGRAGALPLWCGAAGGIGCAATGPWSSCAPGSRLRR
jgi:hypothetical protein